MATTVSSVWGKPGAWALEAEGQEAELKQQQQQDSSSSEFPSLLAAAASTKSKKKNKKGITVSLAEFTAPPQTERLTTNDLLSLPTGPRQRSAEELDRSKLGSSASKWGSSRVFEDGERRESGPSRADETDNWAAAKKPLGMALERRETKSGFSSLESQSKADEVDSWVRSKPSSNGGDRFEKKGSFESLSRNRDSDSLWRRNEESGACAPTARPRLVLQPRTLPVEHVKSDIPLTTVEKKPSSKVAANPFGNARPREEVLAEKGQNWKEIDEKLDAAGSPPMNKGFGLGNGGQGDRTDTCWRKSMSASGNRAEVEVQEPAIQEAKEEETEVEK